MSFPRNLFYIEFSPMFKHWGLGFMISKQCGLSILIGPWLVQFFARDEKAKADKPEPQPSEEQAWDVVKMARQILERSGPPQNDAPTYYDGIYSIQPFGENTRFECIVARRTEYVLYSLNDGPTLEVEANLMHKMRPKFVRRIDDANAKRDVSLGRNDAPPSAGR